MILYDSGSWFGVVFTTAGTVWPKIFFVYFITNIYIAWAYWFSLKYEFNFGVEGRSILLGTLSFLLIFRANQAYSRYWDGRTFVSNFFSDVREFLMLTMLYIRGGIGTSTCLFHTTGNTGARFPIEDAFDAKARELRVDVVRLSVALAVAFKLHTRICFDGYCFGAISRDTKWRADWDRFRLAQLLDSHEILCIEKNLGITEEGLPDDPADRKQQWHDQFHENESFPEDWPAEFEVNMEPRPRLPIIVLYLLRSLLFRSLNDPTNNVPWGIRERFIPTLLALTMSMAHTFEMANQIITTPVPLPYAHLCRTLLLVFLICMPFFIDYRLGWFVNTVIPSVMSMALLGIDAIGTELENPFGDDDNDLDIDELIHTVECEAMEMLALTGDDRGCSCFCWRRLPQFIEDASCRPLRRQLAVKVFAIADSADTQNENINPEEEEALSRAKWENRTLSSLYSQLAE